MSAKRKPLDEITPKEVALMAMEAVGGVISDAAPWMLNWLRENPEWTAGHFDAIALDWIRTQISCAHKNNNRALRGDAAAGSLIDKAAVIPFRSALTEAVNANYSRMMDASIWGGKKIGDATPEEIRESARRFGENGKSMMRQQRWQSAVAEAAEKNGAGANEPVRNVLSPTTFEQLWEKSDAA